MCWQVQGVDVSDFTHEEAVEAIRQAGDRVELLVQSPQVTQRYTCTHIITLQILSA